MSTKKRLELAFSILSHVGIEQVNHHKRIDTVESDLGKMIDEIEDNGVVSDLRKLQRDFKELQGHAASTLMTHARRIETIQTELFKERKAKERDHMTSFVRWFGTPLGLEARLEEVTIAGKVDAIIAHLGLDVTVKPEHTEEAKIEVKKKPATKKKAGKR